jgi:uncharacterized protein (TIGR03118 family)
VAFLFSHRNRRQWPVSRRRRIIRLELEPLEDRSLLSGYQQHNLVGFQPGMAHYTDPLLNGWGLAFDPDGPFWVADTATGVSTVYDHQGKPLPLVVTIAPAPGHPMGPVGSPTGIVYNPTSDFVITKNGKSAPAEFIFDTIDGTISGWNPAVDPTHAVIMVDNSTKASPAGYFGIVISKNSHGKNVLYAADSFNSRIDMFDGGLHSLGSFSDPSVATQYPGYVAYQVEDVNGRLFVTYVTFGPAPFGGIVDVFDTDGHLQTPNHFAANAPQQGPLVNPWGVTLAPADFGIFSNDLLIGNVEDGRINAFNPATGAFLGTLRNPDGTPIVIPGLWDLAFGAGSPNNGKTNELFFTAGPNAITFTGNGLFGMIHAAGVGDGGGPKLAVGGHAGAAGQPGAVIGQDPLAGIVGLLSGSDPASAALAGYQTTVPQPATSWTRQASVQQSAPMSGAPVVSASGLSDRQTIRTKESGTNAAAIDHLFVRFTDGQEDVVLMF